VSDVHKLKIGLSSFLRMSTFYHIPPMNQSREFPPVFSPSCSQYSSYMCVAIYNRNFSFFLVWSPHLTMKVDLIMSRASTNLYSRADFFYRKPKRNPNEPKSIHLKLGFTRLEPNLTRPRGRSGSGRKI